MSFKTGLKLGGQGSSLPFPSSQFARGEVKDLADFTWNFQRIFNEFSNVTLPFLLLCVEQGKRKVSLLVKSKTREMRCWNGSWAHQSLFYQYWKKKSLFPSCVETVIKATPGTSFLVPMSLIGGNGDVWCVWNGEWVKWGLFLIGVLLHHDQCAGHEASPGQLPSFSGWRFWQSSVWSQIVFGALVAVTSPTCVISPIITNVVPAQVSRNELTMTTEALKRTCRCNQLFCQFATTNHAFRCSRL